jgi:glycerate dehydrogenase
VTAKQIAALPSTVELIVEAGTGYNNIDIQAARERGITVCACPAYSTEAVATQVLTFLLAFSSSLHRLQALARDGNHAKWASVGDMPHFELRGKTLGLVGGRGNIGSEVARLARTFGMRVLVSSRTKARMVGAEVVTDVEELLERSDFVSIHCPLNADTHGFIDGAKLAMMKRSAFLINTARGAIVDEAALCSAIKNGIIAGAGLDVFSNEPLPKTSPLWELLCSQDPRVMLTPHIGWQRLETRQRLMSLVADNVRAFLREKPINVVN